MEKDKALNCGGTWQGCPNFKDGGCWVCGANNNGLDGATYWPGYALGYIPDKATRRRHLLSEIAATDAALIDVPGRECAQQSCPTYKDGYCSKCGKRAPVY